MDQDQMAQTQEVHEARDPATTATLLASHIAAEGDIPIVARLSAGRYRTIARGSGLTPQHVSRVLRGMKGCSFHIAHRIAQAALVSLDELYAFIAAQPELVIRPRRTLGDIAADRARRTRTRAKRARATFRTADKSIDKAATGPRRGLRSEKTEGKRKVS